MSLLHLVVLAPFFLAILVPFLYKYIRQVHTGWFVMILPLTLFIYLIQYLPTISRGETIHYKQPWVPSLGINFDVYLDGLSLLFGLLITGIGTLVILYSIYYLYNKKKEALNNFYVYLMMFMGAMLGVVFSDNIMVIYVFWELTSLASSLLIAYWFHKEKSRYGAQKSMLITVGGGLTMLAGFSLLFVISNTFSIREMIAQVDVIVSNPLVIPAMLCVLAGAFTKSAQFPFHIWLPDAMEAPTPVSAYLHSATMVKAGIYLVARMTPVFGTLPEWFWIVSGFGIVTLLWGSVSAIRQKDLKGILAFSTISQLGLIMALLGLGSAAFHYDVVEVETLYYTATLAAVFHLINHATFKGSLFMIVGIVDHETGTRDIRKLGGLMSIMPITFTVALIGTLSMAGVPPFNGFLSKEMFFTAALNATTMNIFNMETFGLLFPIIAWIASIFTFAYCMLMFSRTFLGEFKPEKLEKEVHEAPIGLLIPPIILASLVVIFGLFPNLLAYSIIEPTMAAILPNVLAEGERFYVNIYHWHGFNAELFMTLGVVAFGGLIFFNLKKMSETTFFLGERDPFNRVYDSSLVGLVSGSQKITNMQMTGLLRDYFVFMGVFIVGLMGYTLVRYNAFAIDLVNVAEIPMYFYILAFILVGSIVVVPFISHRITAIAATGVIGFIVALFFVIFRAPDLALTQLMVETVMVVLFLLCFYHLPELRKEDFTPRFKLTNLIVSIGVGLVITITALSAHAMSYANPIQPISDYFIENSYELAAGKNIVNVILVDFRGLDTMLEILVLAIASLGIVVLTKLRFTGGEDV